MPSEPHPALSSLAGMRTVVVVGPGGVGKTTVASALGLTLARRGATVAVVTIDPARRLADALGVALTGGDPEPVALDVGPDGGALWAMMLDAKATFDLLVGSLSPDTATRDRLLENPIYRHLSGAVAGSQEFMAMVKLDELVGSGRFDVVVLDTPPSRNALDFLDAPERLSAFFGGRALRAFTRPQGFGSRLVGRGTGMVLDVLERLTGAGLARDLGSFFAAIGPLIGGLGTRTQRAGRLLRAPQTAFVLVSAPEPGPAAEARFLRGALAARGMPFTALVLNRLRMPVEARGVPVTETPAELRSVAGPEALAAVEATLGRRAAMADRDRRTADALEDALDGPPTVRIPWSAEDVNTPRGLDWLADRLSQG